MVLFSGIRISLRGIASFSDQGNAFTHAQRATMKSAREARPNIFSFQKIISDIFYKNMASPA